MPRPDEGMIHAWLDGELDAVEAERVAKLVAEDAEWGAAVAEARGLIAASSRIVSALDVVPSGVLPAGTRAAPPAKSRFTVRPWMRMAAGFVLVAGTATAVWTRTANAPMSAENLAVSSDLATEPPAEAAEAVEAAEAAALPVPARARPATSAPTSIATANVSPPLAGAAADEVRAPLRDASPAAGVASGAGVSAGAGARQDVGADVRVQAKVQEKVGEAEARRRAPARAAGSAAAPAAALSVRREASAESVADVAATLVGCWRVQVAGRADTMLADPRITRQAGDTLVLTVSADGRLATVHREGNDILRGQAGSDLFVATRVSCPRAP